MLQMEIYCSAWKATFFFISQLIFEAFKCNTVLQLKHRKIIIVFHKMTFIVCYVEKKIITNKTNLFVWVFAGGKIRLLKTDEGSL